MYQSSNLVTSVSTYEGFGLPILEANAVGRPVITSNIASMPEVGGEAVYYVDPHNVDDIRKGILELIQNADLRDCLIKKGLENIKRFKPEVIAAQYCELYENIYYENKRKFD